MNTEFPDARKMKLERQMMTISTGQNAEFLRRFGVSVDMKSNSVVIHQRGEPVIEMGQKRAQFDKVIFLYIL